jgi:hypothetical protein
MLQKVDHTVQLEKEKLLEEIRQKCYILYKLWQARIPLGYRIDYAREPDFNVRVWVTRPILENWLSSFLITLVPSIFKSILQTADK